MKSLAAVDKNAPQKKAEALKRRVMEILKWDDMQFNELQYEAGLEYLRVYTSQGAADEIIISTISGSAIFWQWWRNHWANRDMAFVEFMENTAYQLNEMRDWYREINNAEELAKCIFPSGAILSESYASMITEVVEHETIITR